jgi:signal peptidase I
MIETLRPGYSRPSSWRLSLFGINAISARVRVDGLSMTPTLQNGEYILVNRLAYKTGQPERGDIIVFSFPADEGQDLIKRFIGCRVKPCI